VQKAVALNEIKVQPWKKDFSIEKMQEQRGEGPKKDSRVLEHLQITHHEPNPVNGCYGCKMGDQEWTCLTANIHHLLSQKVRTIF
jgi:hypothetical protein